MDTRGAAKAFIEHYYGTFDANRADLANFYKEDSMLTMEGQRIDGAQNIVAKLTSLPFQQCQHKIRTFDCQSTGKGGGILVMVSGCLLPSGQQDCLKLNQVFHLKPTPQGSLYVLNDFLRLNNA